jgi:TolB-like protein
MWKKVCFLLFLTVILLGCTSSPANNNPQVSTRTSQNMNSREYSLDSNIRICGNDIATRIPSGTSIAVVNIETHEKRLSDFIINELINVIVNKETLRVVTRQRIDELQEELNFNMSGFVSDDTAQSIGKMIGSEVIVIGSITPIGNVYRLNIQTLRTETGEILRAYGYDITYDDRIKGLVNITNVNSTPIEIRGNEVINRNSHNFIQLREYARFLIGGQYYVAIGRFNWYMEYSNRYTGVITHREATGETGIGYVAVHVNPKTGEVLNIVTVNRREREVPTTDELIGGFSVDDYFKTNTWIEAIRYIQQNQL